MCPWIKVSDRLPREGQQVLIVYSDGIAVAAYTSAQADCPDEMGHDAGFLGDRSWPGRSTGVDIFMSRPHGQPTHWMPLPDYPEFE